MPHGHPANREVSLKLLEAIRAFPAHREVAHCGVRFSVPSLEFYAHCPACGARLKLRSLSAEPELEDVFDAVLDWMNSPKAAEAAQARRLAMNEHDQREAAKELSTD